MISAPLRPRSASIAWNGIEPGIQVPFLGNEHRASKRARHGITQRALVLDLTPGGGASSTDS
jgi:hypothetical protein